MPFIRVLNDEQFDHQICLVNRVNRAKTREEHDTARAELNGWRDAIKSCGISWMPCEVDLEIMRLEGMTGAKDERPLCCGVYLDWQPS